MGYEKRLGGKSHRHDPAHLGIFIHRREGKYGVLYSSTLPLPGNVNKEWDGKTWNDLIAPHSYSFQYPEGRTFRECFENLRRMQRQYAYFFGKLKIYACTDKLKETSASWRYGVQKVG